ncbi:MAG: FecR domain-containing protein [Kiritimatiellia bacterium]
MKFKLTTFLLAAAIILLAATAALLIRVLLSTSVPDFVPPREPAPLSDNKPPPDDRLLGHSVVEVRAEAEKEPAPEAGPQPQALPETAPATEPPASEIGKVVLVKGSATAVDPRGKYRVLKESSLIFKNDRVQTAPDSRLSIRFIDGSTVSQGENSALVIDKYIFDPKKKKEGNCALRVVKGFCRVITGLITKANPDRFTVRTKMATIGIRECELAFNSQSSRDDIYILDISSGRFIRIETTVDGSQITDPGTGEKKSVPAEKEKTIGVHEPGTVVSVVAGRGSDSRALTAEDYAEVMDQTSHLDPTAYRLKQKPDGAVFELRPEKGRTRQRKEEEQ